MFGTISMQRDGSRQRVELIIRAQQGQSAVWFGISYSEFFAFLQGETANVDIHSRRGTHGEE